MNPKNILSLALATATGAALGVGATVQAQVAKSDVRENVNAGSLDGFCVLTEKQLVDAGAGGAVTASDLVGMRAEATASLRSFVPDEDPAQCKVSFTLSPAERVAARTFFQDHIRAKLKAACRMP